MDESILPLIDEKVGEVRTESIDISTNEIMSLIEAKEMIIQPDYQRLFRWDLEQRSKLIESIILELPIPEIYVIENASGVFELIDGLQRVSSITQFVNPVILGLERLKLEGCDIITELNSNIYEDLPLRLKLRLKRAVLRTVIIKRQSKQHLRYQMFKRLNTGGSNLSEQEIRNVTARMIGDSGAKFYEFIRECANDTNYKACTETLAEGDIAKRADEEFVLRFFAGINSIETYRNNLTEWLNAYMESILLGNIVFDFDIQRDIFKRTFKNLGDSLGPSSFVRFKNGKPVGALAPAYFEAVSISLARRLREGAEFPIEKLVRTIPEILQREDFKKFTGPGSSKKSDLEGRIAYIYASLA